MNNGPMAAPDVDRMGYLPPEVFSGRDVRKLQEQMTRMWMEGFREGMRLRGVVAAFVDNMRNLSERNTRLELHRLGIDIAALSWAYRDGFTLGWWEHTR